MLDVLESPALVLSQDLREKYFRDGYLGVSGLVSDEWLSRLRQVTAEYVDISRSLDSRGCDAQGVKDRRFDLEPDHKTTATIDVDWYDDITLRFTMWSFVECTINGTVLSGTEIVDLLSTLQPGLRVALLRRDTESFTTLVRRHVREHDARAPVPGG